MKNTNLIAQYKQEELVQNVNDGKLIDFKSNTSDASAKEQANQNSGSRQDQQDQTPRQGNSGEGVIKNLNMPQPVEDDVMHDGQTQKVASGFAGLPFSLNDIGMGKAFADYFHGRVKYVAKRKGWYIYNPHRGIWEFDNKGLINEYAKEFTSQYLIGLAKQITDDDKRSKYMKFIGKMQKKTARDTLLADAQSEKGVAAAIEKFDADMRYLNLENYVYDLENDCFLAHSPAFMMTKSMNVIYDPEMICLRFEAFINEIMCGDAELAKYLQKCLGYALSGKPNEDMIFMWHGLGTRNGKSTLARIMGSVFGDYARNANAETFAKSLYKSGSSPNGDVARLAGSRLVLISEPDKDMNLDEGFVKKVTGRDPLTARFLYKEDFEIIPTFAVNMLFNNLPRVNDKTIFRSERVAIIPFNARFVGDDREKDLSDILTTPDAASAVLNWLLEGYRLYKAEGLRKNVPQVVKDAVNEYSGQSDPFGKFIDENICESMGTFTQSKAIYDRFCLWAADNGHEELTQTAITQRVKNLGYETGSDGKARGVN